jgi:hypothetical protein
LRAGKPLPVESSDQGAGWISMAKDDEEAFIKFLRRLQPDSPSTEHAYQATRLKLKKYFQWKRCNDPQDLADETIKRLVAKLKDKDDDSDTIESPSGYLRTFAKHVYYESVRQNIKDEKIAKGLQEVELQFVDEQEDCRKECLQKLAPQDRELIIAYYAGVALDHTNLNSLRVRIHRIKMKLKACYEECLKKPNAK